MKRLARTGILTIFALFAAQDRALPAKPTPPAGDPAIAYEADTSGGIDLMVMDADGANQRVVIAGRGFNNRMPNWSPDGTQLTFVSTRGGSPGIYIINVDGTGLCRVGSTNQEWFVGPVWSPLPIAGGYKIAFSDSEPAQDYHFRDLFLVDAVCNAPSPVNLTNTANVTEWFPTWSPLADRLAVQLSGPFLEVDVYDLDPTTGAIVGARRLTDGGPFETRVTAEPDWDRNFDRIVLEANGADEMGGLWLLDFTDAANPTYRHLTRTADGQETSDQHEINPSFSPDGTQIVFRRQPLIGFQLQRPIGLYKMDVITGQLTLLASTGKRIWDLRYPDWRRNP